MSEAHHATYIPALKYRDHYDVVHQGKIIVTNSSMPFCDTARALQALGLKGRLILSDQRGMPCLLGSIEVAAKQMVSTSEDGTPIFVKYNPDKYSKKKKP